MFRNYFAAALRNLVRNRLYTAINVLGLAVGFAAALLIALFIHDELSYDKWIPGHERTYLLTSVEKGLGPDSRLSANPAAAFAPLLKLEFPAIEHAAQMGMFMSNATLRRAERESSARVFWADPEIFAVLPMRAVAGNLATALDQPDSIVLTRKLARRYFGRDAPIGENIEFSREHLLRVTAIIEDLPSNTHLTFEALISGRAPFSANAGQEFTYLRCASSASAAELRNGLTDFHRRHKEIDTKVFSFGIMPIAEVHWSPLRSFGFALPGNMATLYAFGLVGVVIVLAAVVNFVNLTTARATRRAVEIGVRKVSGAERRDLVVQFIGESFLYVLFAVALAMILAHIILPRLNGLLGTSMPTFPVSPNLDYDRTIASPFAQSPIFLIGMLGIAAVTALLAGFYPALVLSAFRPVIVLRAAKADSSGIGRLRQGLVVLQFAALIGLMVIAAVTYRQTVFALRENLRLDIDQVLMISTGPPPTGLAQACAPAFKDSVAALPGVRGVQCATEGAIGIGGTRISTVTLPDGTKFGMGHHAVDFGFFSFYGLAPVAGRAFQRERADLEASQNPEATVVPTVINEAAARQFGFGSPDAAVGHIVSAGETFGRNMAGSLTGTKATQIEIIGVVPDIVGFVENKARPTAYYLAPTRFDMLSVRLAGSQIPETLEAIDRLWKQHGDPTPTPRQFLSAQIEVLHRGIIQQAELFAAFAGVAVFIAALGMFGLATFIAERRTKEIGVRKSMGATRGDILRLLVWEFCKPVLLANLIAWPVAYFFMRRWLEGFAYHIDMRAWMFLAASAAALVIAVLTVTGHALLVARTRPATALRYE